MIHFNIILQFTVMSLYSVSFPEIFQGKFDAAEKKYFTAHNDICVIHYKLYIQIPSTHVDS
jgi:hypothetical protein